MTDAEFVRDLRKRGFAVVVFSPEEIDGIDRYILEGQLVEEGNNIIEELKNLHFLEKRAAVLAYFWGTI